jgi:HEAT repeat protein/protein-S-isoprenylcysteine O-methyltransferase Ste14
VSHMTNLSGKKSERAWMAGLLVLALVFSIGLTFASFELPRLLHTALGKATPALEGDSHADEAAIYRTELFLDHYHFRVVGYVCFGLMVLLIVAGFATGKAGLSSIGAAAMFLPVFAQFAGVMFFLAGLGFLNLTWLPVLDVSFDVGRLGDIVFWPYNVLMSIFRGWGIDAHKGLAYAAVGLGLLLFILGTLAWFVARHRKRDVADFWVYRLCRHPQYLGWIVWSYGMLLALQRVRYPKRSWGIPASLPWILSMMVIVGVALLEERKMKRLSGERYEEYRKKTSFLVPLPRFLRAVFAAPNRLLFRKSFPERKGEIAVVLVLYTAVLMAASHVYVRQRDYAVLDVPVGILDSRAVRVEKLVDGMKRTDNWRRRSGMADMLAEIGGPAVDPLIGLLDDPNPEVRRDTARALGKIGDDRAVGPLLGKLTDENDDVRFKAIEALGGIGSDAAAGPLISILESKTKDFSRIAATALARLGSEAAVEPLIGFLDSPNWWDRGAAVDALGGLGSEAALEPLIARFEGEDVHVRRSIVVALLKIGSGRAVGFLEKALEDEDRDVRLFAAEALKKLK